MDKDFLQEIQDKSDAEIDRLIEAEAWSMFHHFKTHPNGLLCFQPKIFGIMNYTKSRHTNASIIQQRKDFLTNF